MGLSSPPSPLHGHRRGHDRGPVLLARARTDSTACHIRIRDAGTPVRAPDRRALGTRRLHHVLGRSLRVGHTDRGSGGDHTHARPRRSRGPHDRGPSADSGSEVDRGGDGARRARRLHRSRTLGVLCTRIAASGRGPRRRRCGCSHRCSDVRSAPWLRMVA